MKKKIANSAFLVVLAAIIAFFSLSYIFVDASDFSEDENRALQTAPRFTFSKLLDGTYTAQLQSYFSDQISFRSAMIKIKATLELAAGKNENNGVLYGADGYLIETYPYTEDNYEYLQKNLAKIERLMAKSEESGVKAWSVIIPRKVDVLTDVLPPYYSVERNETPWSFVGDGHITLTDTLSKAWQSGTQVFYKTDHHWTADATLISYKALSEILGYAPLSDEYFNMQLLSSSFFGTTYSTSGFFFADADAIYAPTTDMSRFTVEIVDTGRTLDGFYDKSYLDVKDKYSTFLSGNNAHVKIYDNESESKETLLIIKDSYSHSLAPLLAEHYNLELIDPRYYTGSISEYIEENDIKNVLFLFGLDTLASANISIR